MAQTFKVLSALLNYPTAELVRAVPELRDVVAGEGIVAGNACHALDLLLDDIASGDLYDLQERYVLLFDRTRSLSLHLFEHVHGESRDRGQAMIDLKTLYESNGLTISATELPDFLPLFLEYLSTRPPAEAAETLGQTVHILSSLAERLAKRASPYQAAFQALLAIATAKPKDAEVAELLQEPDPDPTDLAALDAAWEDEPVTFGPGANSCKDGVIARIRAAKRPASQPNR
jgi:nitrate reductase molybdenum cofactor assembly chaperone NarJ/NarW